MMDKIDEFLYQKDDPSGGISIYNSITKTYDILNEEEVKLVQKLREGTFADSNFNPYPEYVDYFTGEKLQLPINCAPDPKRRFVPSISEHRKITKLICAIRNGLQLTKYTTSRIPQYSDIWSLCSEKKLSRNDRKRILQYWDAPKLTLPSTSESYHPPLEYLPDSEELQHWNDLIEEKKRGKFLPTFYKCLRHVPSYDLISQNYDRCLDLYMAPRKRKLMALIEPEDLLSKVPDPASLQPFPSWESIAFNGHYCRITNLSVHISGELLISGDVGGTVIIWENIGVELKRRDFGNSITGLEWSTRSDFLCNNISKLLSENRLVIMCYDYGNSSFTMRAQKIFSEFLTSKSSELQWLCPSNNLNQQSLINVEHKFAPFKKSNVISDAIFHPTKPHMFIVGIRHVKIYDLRTQNVLYKLMSGMNLITASLVHLSGDHFIVGSEDQKIGWFDIDLNKKPYRILKSSVCLSFLDCTILLSGLLIFTLYILSWRVQVSHPLLLWFVPEHTSILLSSVISDLTTNPLIVPVKILNPKRFDNGAVTVACRFHPITPSLFSCDEAGVIRLFE
ncbi:hypothetical protein MXB_21 [Myxobolus squamalis]|nr:hypothetical protein MXB_21 [Myxobolus squamalis]